MDPEHIWQKVLAEIQLNISEANFSTWFKGTKALKIEKDTLIVSAPNSFVREWLENKYQKTILKIVRDLGTEIKQISFILEKSFIKQKEEQPLSFNKTGQAIFKEFQINKETGLNSRYTFQNFIVGSFNELAHAASWAVTENPGTMYNPLFIYGKVGLGKTHLLQAIGNQICKNFKEKRVRYLPSQKFTDEIIRSIKERTIDQLKRSYQQIDVLVLDDVQFLAGKEKTQEEFFHIFNDLYQKNRQVVISSDKPPKAIPALTERLRSRFEGGMIADISYPDFETRLAILKNKAQEKQINFLEEIYHFIAENIKTNIRELEGALSKLILYQTIKGKSLTLEEAKTIFEKSFSLLEKKLTPHKIIEIVADFYDLKEKDLLSSSRKKEIVKPRQVAMFFLRKKANFSFPFIAKLFGNKDHTTVIYSYEKISQEIEKNENLEREINLINNRLLELDV